MEASIEIKNTKSSRVRHSRGKSQKKSIGVRYGDFGDCSMCEEPPSCENRSILWYSIIVSIGVLILICNCVTVVKRPDRVLSKNRREIKTEKCLFTHQL